MSLMAVSAQRSSVFTFESTVHSSHVLRWLDEQRCRDMLCDVTVVVEAQSFRAHRSVLASCSEYFAQRISALTQHGAVITLPQEVTAAGFEPLLKFAYTSKLHFSKDNVLEIRNAASILGCQDLDETCFDFLPPKFFSSSSESVPFLRKTCCKKKCKRRSPKKNCGTDSDDMLLDNKEVKPVADSSSEQEVAWDCDKSESNKMGSQDNTKSLAPVTEGKSEHFRQFLKYRKFQIACGKENCATEKSLTNPAMSVNMDDCVLPCSPCSSNATSTNQTGNTTFSTCRDSEGGAKEPWKTDTREIRTENVEMVKKDTFEREKKWHDEITENNFMKLEKVREHIPEINSSNSVKTIPSEPSTMLCERSSELRLDYCPPRTWDKNPAITRSLEHEMFVIDIKDSEEARDPGVLEPGSLYHNVPVEAEGNGSDNACLDGRIRGQTGNMERGAILVDNTRQGSTMEKEVVDYLAKRLWSDKGTSQLNFQEPVAGHSTDTEGGWAQNPSSECPKRHNNLNSTGSSCSFLQDLDQIKCSWGPAGMSECEGASQSGVSSVNSGEDGDSETETEGDSESSTRERARQVQLPFPVEWIINLSRNDFQQLLKQHVFTREQLDFVHDMRRRSKNRLAAQRCRKRKLDCIYNLQCEINKLKTEREKLMMEKSQLSQLKSKTCHSVTALCQRVCNEANLQPDQLQVLAKYSTSDCPLSSVFPQIDTLLSQHGLPLHPQTSLLACAGGLETYEASEEETSSSSRDTVSGQ
ncbi:transcription regulator protein BACH1b [Odontesthes bonariensis]|uniref:transcription regulator protein BACH1b n=1 Tax=Odontesthes bonariensis TaxID=219752 RepID=UPI003F58F09A